jgi:RNA polymerase sigma factor (sigma-70 family)
LPVLNDAIDSSPEASPISRYELQEPARMSEVDVRDHTKQAFQRLVIPELPALYSLARRLVRNGAEDLVQEALLRGYRSFGTLQEDGAAGPWLKSILVNVFRDQLRKQARSVQEMPVEDVEGFSLYRTLVEFVLKQRNDARKRLDVLRRLRDKYCQ